MNLEEFDNTYKCFQHDRIEIKCDKCNKSVNVEKVNAKKQIEKHGLYQCRSCGIKTMHENRSKEKFEETNKKISESNRGKIFSEESRKRMSEAKKIFYQTDRGIEHKKELSITTSKQHIKDPDFYKKNCRGGLFMSEKNNKLIPCSSSYELRYCFDIDKNPDIIGYEVQLQYDINERGRRLDFLITMKNETKVIAEIKPAKRVKEFQLQISDAMDYAKNNGFEFKLITEKEIGMSEYEIMKWADQYRTEHGDFDYIEYRKNKNNEKQKKHYAEKVKNDRIDVYCKFCKETHNILRLSYENGIKNNGRYICIVENGNIVGKKPKKKKDNPYANEGKKQCTKCNEILTLKSFSKDKSRRDGYHSSCKKCEHKRYEI